MKMLSGIIPPVPTPFSSQGDLDTESLKTLIAKLEPEVDGLLILGSNGEAAYLSEEERRAALEAARSVIPQSKPMIAGTGGEATRIVIERNQTAAEAGADYVLVVAPFYFKGGMTEAVLQTHFETVASESPIPVLLYNIPQATTLSLSPALIAKLAQHPNIAGLKDSSGNVGALTETMRQVPADFTVLTGNAPTLLPALSLGVAGGILAVANVAPKAYKRIVSCFQAGQVKEARNLQLRLNPLALAVTSKYGVPGLKAALRQQGRTAGHPRAPLQDVNTGIEKELKSLLALLD